MSDQEDKKEIGKVSDNPGRFQLRQGHGDHLKVVKSVATREEADEELKKFHQERSQAIAEINEAYPETTIVDTGVKPANAGALEGVDAHRTADEKKSIRPPGSDENKDGENGENKDESK